MNRISVAVNAALLAVAQGVTVKRAAELAGCHVRSIYRHLAKAKKAPAPAADVSREETARGQQAPADQSANEGQVPNLAEE